LQYFRVKLSVTQIFAPPLSHNLTSPTIGKPPIYLPSLKRSPPTPPKMTSLHQRLNQENVHARESAVEGLHSRWSSSSSSQVTVDKLPSQPLSPRQQRQRGSACGRLQRSDSKWTTGSGVIADSSPLQPLSRRRSAVGRLEQSGSRWSSGSQAAFDTAASQALVRH
jgi:hypothetical protein